MYALVGLLALINWTVTSESSINGILKLGEGDGPPPMRVSGLLSRQRRRLDVITDQMDLSLEATREWIPIISVEALVTHGMTGTLRIGPNGQLSVRAFLTTGEVSIADGRLTMQRCASNLTRQYPPPLLPDVKLLNERG